MTSVNCIAAGSGSGPVSVEVVDESSVPVSLSLSLSLSLAFASPAPSPHATVGNKQAVMMTATKARVRSKSGARVTARLYRMSGREVIAVPSNITSIWLAQNTTCTPKLPPAWSRPGRSSK
jgi:hypothetical protein